MGNRIGTGRRRVTKGRLGSLQFQVNPTTIDFGGGGYTWGEITSPGMLDPIKMCGAGTSRTFNFELYINEWMHDYVVNAQNFVDTLEGMKRSKDSVKFVLGSKVWNVIVSDSVVKAQAFNPDLTIREALITVQLSEIVL